MQEGTGERRRVQASHWKLQKLGFHQPGREQVYQCRCIVITFRPWGLGPLLLLSPPPWGLGGVITDTTLRTQGWHHCCHLEAQGLVLPLLPLSLPWTWVALSQTSPCGPGAGSIIFALRA